MNKQVAIIGALAGLISAILLTTGLPSFGHAFTSTHSGTCASSSNSPVVTRVLPWQGGESVEIGVPATVHFVAGTQWRAVATGPEAILKHLQFNHGKLKSVRSLHWCDADVTIELTGPDVRHWTLAGSGHLHLERLEQSDVDLEIHGSGSATAGGRVEHASVLVAGSGAAKLGQLVVKDASVQIWGSGDVDIAPVDTAQVEIGGSGNVRLLRKPRNVQTRIQGSGSVIDAG